MAILSFLMQLAGATMLLLFAVRMVRTGIERAFGPAFRRWVTTEGHRLRSAGLGVGLAMILQSSAAVVLLVAGFAGAGGLVFGTGLSIVLGADLGSALLIQILSLRLDGLVPVLLALGGMMFLKSDQRNLRQAGRIVLGIAFILIALRFLRETVEPIRESGLLPALSAWFERDFVTAFLAGAALAFVMHSSVATILMIVTVVGIGALPAGAGLSLLLGANLGSALIPLWLTRGMDPVARRIPLANLGLRGTASILVLLGVNWTGFDPFGFGMPAHQELVLLHILFNAGVLVLGLPLVMLVEAPVRMFLPDAAAPGAVDVPLHYRTALDETCLDRPALALASLRREVLRMEQLVEEMMTPAMGLFVTFERGTVKTIRAKELLVNAAFDGIRRYAAGIARSSLKKSDEKELRELVEYSIALEAAGDVVAKSLLVLAEEKDERHINFSKDGFKELGVMHQRVLQNLNLAARVLVSNDLESARLLLSEKDEMRQLHRASRKKHLRRLTSGEEVSFNSSDIHLETAHALKEFNAQVASVAYPILFREGQLLETRLIRRMDEDYVKDD